MTQEDTLNADSPFEELPMPALFLAALIAANPLSPFKTRTEAAQAIAEGHAEQQKALEQLVSAGKLGLWALAEAAKTQEGPELGRLYAAMGYFEQEGALWVMRKGLKSEEQTVRLGALEGLARHNHESVPSILFKHVADPSAEVRAAVVAGLLTHAPAYKEKISELQTTEAPEARDTCYRYLARTQSGGNLKKVINSALRDSSSIVRKTGIRMAQAKKDPSFAPRLHEIASGNHLGESLLAVEALSQLVTGSRHLTQILVAAETSTSVSAHVMSLLRNERQHLITRLAPSLAIMPQERQKWMLEEIAKNATKIEYYDAVYLLSRTDGRLVDLAQKLLSTFGKEGDRAATHLLLDAPPRLRKAIEIYLSRRPAGGIDEQTITEAFAGPLKDRIRAIRLIGELAPADTRLKLIPLLEDEDARIRAVAVAACGELPESEAPLLKLIKDPSEIVRAAVVVSLHHHSTPAAKAAQKAALKDDNTKVRLAAIQGFVGTEDLQVLKVLLKSVQKGSEPERMAAVRAIAESRTLKAAIMLVELVAGDDVPARTAALKYIDDLYAQQGQTQLQLMEN